MLMFLISVLVIVILILVVIFSCNMQAPSHVKGCQPVPCISCIIYNSNYYCWPQRRRRRQTAADCCRMRLQFSVVTGGESQQPIRGLVWSSLPTGPTGRVWPGESCQTEDKGFIMGLFIPSSHATHIPTLKNFLFDTPPSLLEGLSYSHSVQQGSCRRFQLFEVNCRCLIIVCRVQIYN